MHRLHIDFGNTATWLQSLDMRRDAPDMPLRDFLAHFSVQPEGDIPPDWLDQPVSAFDIKRVQRAGSLRAGFDQAAADRQQAATASTPPPATADPPPPPAARPDPPPPDTSFPERLSDHDAVARAYADDIHKIADYLSNNLSVLVVCDKILAEDLFRHALRHSNKQPVLEGDPSVSETAEGERSGALFQREASGAQTRVAAIGRLQAGLKDNQVLVLRHLDMLVGGSGDGPPSPEARLLTEVLYRHSTDFIPTLLAFADPSIGLPRVLTDRFAVRMEIAGLSRDVIPALITRDEYERFDRFDRELLFKNVSGFNVIQLRNAMRYLHAKSMPGTSATRLMQHIREFKRGSGEDIEIPDITFDQIGGYETVKHQLFEAIELITGRRPPFNPDGSPYELTDSDLAPLEESEAKREKRRKLAPRGFIFHGDPGTGKTLFAKAIANAMNATIQMVSGPEIMDMWVGKSESNLRRLFTIARRNAPAVIFFDEFDSIAAQRSGFSDGGSRASNAVVAQLLTELDGFHADQDLLVIGTTNRLNIIDAALLRPSRFQPIEIGLPDDAARLQIAKIHASNYDVKLPHESLLSLIVDYTKDFNGDEIRAIFQQIARDEEKGLPVTPEAFGVQIGLIKKRRDERLISHLGAASRRTSRSVVQSFSRSVVQSFSTQEREPYVTHHTGRTARTQPAARTIAAGRTVAQE